MRPSATRAWPAMPPERRRRLVDRLVTLAEDDVKMGFDAVFRHGLKDEDPDVREKSVSGLWECDDRTLLEPLIELLNSDPVERVRALAAISLGKFCTLAALGKLLPKDGQRIEEGLISVVESDQESVDVRRRALESVAAFNTSKPEELIQEAYRSSEPTMRVSAVYAMGRTCHASWLPTVLYELDSNDASMRYEAVNACAELAEEEEVPSLIPLLEDEDLQGELSAVRTLGALGGRLARRMPLRCFDASEEVIQDAAKAALELMDADEDPVNIKFRLERE